MLLLSLISHSQADPSFNHVTSRSKGFENWAGLTGAYASGLLADIFGLAAYLIPIALLTSAGRHYLKSGDIQWWRWVGLTLLAMCIATFASAIPVSLGDINGGGLLGNELYRLSTLFLGVAGSSIIWLFLFIVALQLAVGFTWATVAALLATLIASIHMPERMRSGNKATRSEKTEYIIEHDSSSRVERPPAVKKSKAGAVWNKAKEIWKNFFPSQPEGELVLSQRVELPAAEEDRASLFAFEDEPVMTSPQPRKEAENAGQFYIGPELHESQPLANLQPEVTPSTTVGADSQPRVKQPEPQKAAAPVRPKRKIALPSVSLLETPKGIDKKAPRAILEEKGQTLVNCLADFGIQGELVRITPGPVVTMFEIRPAAGVKVSRIANLSDDLALALKAIAVRIQAPIPGKDTVGIEIPNEERETVSLKELLGADSFSKAESLLTMAVGKDIAGTPTVADLAKMPHLLVAGATGAGKSVCINSILMSFLYKSRPEEVQLLLVDPKRIELAVYADLPHLVHPVVTDMSQAKNALDWAVHEMDKRYEAMARLGVRNVTSYNQKLKDVGDKRPPELCDLELLPYLVIIIDELADLMLTAAKEVETSIVRLAQLARAAGIHMILATQRPSVDVVTGLIKANFPCRISFQVTSKHDSRTILDTVGAEHLLGRGDMLFKPGGGRLQRMHGAFVSDEDVVTVVNYWKERQAPSYRVDFAEWGSPAQDENAVSGSMGGDSVADDPVYAEAVQFVMAQGKASISLIQRRFRIGFNRAARYVEQMEQDGIIGPADGSKPRMVIGARES
ncbi:MAG: DNA translocase FtsK [Oleidesulfovibrio sp.]